MRLWWLSLALSAVFGEQCEYTIVGSGWSGFYFAWRLTQPPLSINAASICMFEARTRIGGRAYAFSPEELMGWDNRTILDMGSYYFNYNSHQLVRSVVSDFLQLPTQCYHPGTCANSSDEFQRIVIPDGPGQGNPASFVRGIEGLRDALYAAGMPPVNTNHRLVSVFEASVPLPPPPSCTDPTVHFGEPLVVPPSPAPTSAASSSVMTLRFRIKVGENCTWVHVNTSTALLNIPSTSFHTLTTNSIVFTKARPEVLKAYDKPMYSPLAKIFLVYQNAWWKNVVNVTTAFNLQPTEIDEISLSGRFYDAPTFNNCSQKADCPGALLIYTQAPETAKEAALYDELWYLRNYTDDVVTRLVPGHDPLGDGLFDKIHNSLLDYFESPLLKAGIDPSTLPRPSSLVFSLWWATDYATALSPSWESRLIDCDMAKLFLRPTTKFDLFLANEAWSCGETGWADPALREVEKLLVWRYNYSKPATVSQSYWEELVLGGPSRGSASLLPRIPDCFVSTDCAGGAVCVDYLCSPPCTNDTYLTDCAALNSNCRIVGCGSDGFCQVTFQNGSCATNTSCSKDVCRYGYCEVGASKCVPPAHPDCFMSECNAGNCSMEIKVNASCADETHPCGGTCDAQGECRQTSGLPIGAQCTMGSQCCSGFCIDGACSEVPPSECHFSEPNFALGWRFHDDLVTLVFSSNSSGWLALGLGVSMTDSDIIVGWIDATSGVGFVGDYWSTGTRTPRADTVLGGTYDLLNAKVESLPSGFITISVTRKLDTGDQRDRVISPNQNDFIYAFKNGVGGDFSMHDDYNSITVAMNCQIKPFAPNVRPGRKPTRVVAGEAAVTQLTTFDANYNRIRNGGFGRFFSTESSPGVTLSSSVVDLDTGRYLLAVNLTRAEPAVNFTILFANSEIESALVTVDVDPGPFASAKLGGLQMPTDLTQYPFWLVATDAFLNPVNSSEALRNRAELYAVAYIVEDGSTREELPTTCSNVLSPFGDGGLGFACTFDSPHKAEIQHFIDVRVFGATTRESPYLVPHAPHVWATWVIWLLVISVAIVLVLTVFIVRTWRKEKLAKKREKEDKRPVRQSYGALVD